MKFVPLYLDCIKLAPTVVIFSQSGSYKNNMQEPITYDWLAQVVVFLLLVQNW